LFVKRFGALAPGTKLAFPPTGINYHKQEPASQSEESHDDGGSHICATPFNAPVKLQP
jgi:hypothetical protein